MKSEQTTSRKAQNLSWIIDESKYLSSEEVSALRESCSEVLNQGLRELRFALVRDWFMIELGLNAGLRVNEMASLRREHLLIDNGRSSIRVIGKGNKKRPVWISTSFREICLLYLAHRRSFGFPDNENSYVLNNLKGLRISKRALQKAFKRIIKDAGLPEHYYIHCLRHTYTTFLLKASNHNYRFAQRQLGHASIRTTQVYAGVLESEGRYAIERLYE